MFYSLDFTSVLGCARQGFAGAGSSRVAIFDGGCSLLLSLGSASQGGQALLVEKLGGGGGGVVVRLLLGLACRDLVSGNIRRPGRGRGSGRHGAARQRPAHRGVQRKGKPKPRRLIP